MSETPIDATDHALLRLLRENARSPVAELARRLGLSRTTIQSRIERLERRGIIEGYRVTVSDAARRGLIRAYVLIDVMPKLSARAEAGLRRIAEIAALHSVSGQHDLIALVEAPSIEAMDRLIDGIGGLEGIERTQSSIILSTKLSRPEG